MSKNYSVLESKLTDYEAEPEKVELLQSKDYAVISETDEYKELAKHETYFSMTKEEIENKLNGIIATYAKQGMNFSVTYDNDDANENGKKPVKKTFSFFPVAPTSGGMGKKKNYSGLSFD